MDVFFSFHKGIGHYLDFKIKKSYCLKIANFIISKGLKIMQINQQLQKRPFTIKKINISHLILSQPPLTPPQLESNSIAALRYHNIISCHFLLCLQNSSHFKPIISSIIRYKSLLFTSSPLHILLQSI